MNVLLLLGAILMLSVAVSGAEELHVLNWKDYGTDQPFAVEAFAAMTGDTVVNDVFDSEEEMLAKLRSNPGRFDVVVINAAFMRRALQENLVHPIDTTKISNYGNIDPDHAGLAMLTADGKNYGIPWTWGLTTLAIDDTAFEQPPTSLEALWDQAHKGRVTMRDDAVEAIQLGALATGQSINSVTDMAAVKQSLGDLLPNLAEFWRTEDEWNRMVASDEIDLGTYWSGSVDRARRQLGLPVTLVVPEEGAVGWLDSLAIPAGSDNVEGAEAFIDYMLSPEFYVAWDAAGGAPVSANRRAVAALPADSFNRVVMGAPEVADRVQFQEPLSGAELEAYGAVWQALKGDAK